MYRFHIKHVPGKLNAAPDCTSRYPASPKLSDVTSIDITQQIDRAMQASIISAYEHDPKIRAITWDRIVAAAATDEECRALAEYIQNGFPRSCHELPSKIRQFWSMADQLYYLDGMPIKENKILRQLRAEVLEALHSAHQGVNGMMANARQRLFWPGLDASIQQTRTQCRKCNIIAPSQPREPLMPPSNAEFPFQKTVTDLFDLHGKTYLVYADRYTGWMKVTIIREGYSCIRGPTELVLHIRCTGGEIFGWRTTVWFTGIQVILGGLGREKANIISALPSEQWPSWTGCKNRKKNADRLYRWIWSLTPRPGDTGNDDP